MADATYDVVFVGGGSKALATAVYLAKYGGMSVAMFERKNEMGGALAADESAAPGFTADTHITIVAGPWYWEPISEDFPGFEERGGKLGHYLCSGGVITREDHHCFLEYSELEDPSAERTLKSVADFAGEQDAETYSKLLEVNKEGGPLWQAWRKQVFNPPPPPGQPGPMAMWFDEYLKQPDCLVDESWKAKRLLHAAMELWEYPGMQYHMLRATKSAGGQSAHMCGLAVGLLTKPNTMRQTRFVIGGMHNIAHAYIKILLENGGKFFTKSHVTKILVENGKAKGIRLADGTEIEAKQMVVTGVSPFDVVFEMLDEEHVSAKIRKKLSCVSRREHQLNWFAFAVHEMPKYKAAAFNPDVQIAQQLHLGNCDPYELMREDYWRLLDKHQPGDSFSIMASHSVVDKTQAPEGKGIFVVEEEEIPANILTERQWMERHKEFADKVVNVMGEYAPNMTWDNVIGYHPFSPYHCAMDTINTGPAGMLSILDYIPGQIYPWRPIPEMAHYKIPGIESLYTTGSGWGLGPGGSCAEGYSCYKVIAGDFNLRKPWEEKGRLY